MKAAKERKREQPPPKTRKTSAQAQGHGPQDMTGSEIVVDALIREGVEVVFGYPGGANIQSFGGELVGRDASVTFLCDLLGNSIDIRGRSAGVAITTQIIGPRSIQSN